jgi:hypothetical protein
MWASEQARALGWGFPPSRNVGRRIFSIEGRLTEYAAISETITVTSANVAGLIATATQPHLFEITVARRPTAAMRRVIDRMIENLGTRTDEQEDWWAIGTTRAVRVRRVPA